MRRIAPPLLSLVVLLSLACASGNPETPEVGERGTNLNIQMRRGGQNLNLRTTAHLDVVHDTLSGSSGDLFSLLPEVYNDLEIPISSVNTEAHALGVLEARARGDFAGERISRWLDCGTSITGNIAEQREVYITALTQVEALEEPPGVSGISVHVKGYAIQSGRAGNRTGCRSTGRLERAIIADLREMAGRGGSGG